MFIQCTLYVNVPKAQKVYIVFISSNRHFIHNRDSGKLHVINQFFLHLLHLCNDLGEMKKNRFMLFAISSKVTAGQKVASSMLEPCYLLLAGFYVMLMKSGLFIKRN